MLVAAGTSAARAPAIPVFGDNVLEATLLRAAPGAALQTVGDTDPSLPLDRESRAMGRREILLRRGRRCRRARASSPRLTDQTPLLLEKKIGEGRVLLFASGLDNLTNDFPLHPVFVPFVEQTARYLSGTERRSGSRLVDSFLDLRTAKEQAVGVEVVDPDGRRPLSLKEATTAQSFQLTQAGFYQLRLANGRQDVIGVNPDRRESDLTSCRPTSWRSGVARNSAGPGGPAEAATTHGPAEEKSKPYSLWWYVMLVALAAALCGILASQPVSGDATGGIHEHAGTAQLLYRRIEQRLRLGTAARGAAILTLAALVTTVVLVLIVNAVRAFRKASLTSARAHPRSRAACRPRLRLWRFRCSI